MKNFNYLFLISLLVFAGNGYSVNKNNISKHQEDSCEDMWDKSSDTEKQEKPRKKTLIKRDLLVVGTIIAAYAFAVYTKTLQSPMKIGEKFYKNFIAEKESVKNLYNLQDLVLTEEDKECLAKKHECIACCDEKQCIKYCNKCYKQCFTCIDCINNTVKFAKWIYVDNKRIKNIKCQACNGPLNQCFDEKYLLYEDTTKKEDDPDAADIYQGPPNDIKAFKAWFMAGKTKSNK